VPWITVLSCTRALGEGYGARVEGLQLPVSRDQSGPLERALYIPYRQRVER